MDRIIIKNAELLCNIGTYPEERSRKQKIFVDAELLFDTRQAAKKDDLRYTINYSDVLKLMRIIAGKIEYNLLEALANDLAEIILKKFKTGKVTIKVKKKLPGMDYAAVRVSRK